jgi:hypothetical protein
MDRPPGSDDDQRQRDNLVVLAAVAIIVVIGICLLTAFKHSSALVDCFAAGHKNCTPVEMPSSN